MYLCDCVQPLVADTIMSGGAAAQTAAKMSTAGSSGGFFAEFQDRIVARDPNTIGILVACLVGLLTLILAILWTRRRIFGRGQTVFR